MEMAKRFLVSFECEDEETAQKFVRLSNAQPVSINGEAIKHFRYEGELQDTARISILPIDSRSLEESARQA